MKYLLNILAALVILSLVAACDDDETPSPADQLATESSATAIPSEIPESSPATGPPSWVYNVTHGEEHTIWEETVIGAEVVNNIGCYITETTYDVPPGRTRVVDMTLESESAWRAKDTLDQVKKTSSVIAMGSLEVDSTVTTTYTGSHGAQFTEGKSWSYEEYVEATMGQPSTKTWVAEVVAIEEITVPAGLFKCHKVIHTQDSGAIITEWWAIDDNLLTPVKVVNEASWNSGAEVKELESYVEGEIPADKPETTAEPTPEPTTALSYTEQLMQGAAWIKFCDVLEKAGETVLRDDMPGSERDRVDGYIKLLGHISRAIELFIYDWDPDFPYLMRSDFIRHKYGIDNPDTLYLMAPIRGDATYRITGTRGTVPWFSIQVNAGRMGFDPQFSAIGSMDTTEIEFEDDGSFEVVLSADPQSGNWLPLEPNVDYVTVRQNFYDWENDVPAEFRIVRVWQEADHPSELTPTEMAERMDLAGRYIDSYMTFWSEFGLDTASRIEVNTCDEPHSYGATAGEQYLYSGGPFILNPEEALIVEVSESDPLYFGFQLATIWTQSFDYENRQTSLNGHQAYLDSDGIYRFVIAHEDPGVPNWLDTTGYSEGLMSLRWAYPEATPTVATKVVAFDKVWDEFPADTPYVDENARKGAIAVRQAYVSRLYHP